VFAEPFDKVIALAHVKAAGANALEDVDEVHVRKWSGRLDLNQRPSRGARARDALIRFGLTGHRDLEKNGR
jgi:hypothetical protein